MRRVSLRHLGLVALVGAVLAAACSSDSTTTTPSTPTSPVTETFSSIVFPNGSISHSFKLSASGTITVTLVSAGPPSNIVMRLGVGVAVAPGGCSLTTLVDTAAGASPQLTIAADVNGDASTDAYCVAILDVGNAPKTGSPFLINVVHP